MKTTDTTMHRTEALLGFLYTIFQITLLPEILRWINSTLPTPLSIAELNFAIIALNFIFVTALLHQYLISAIKTFLKRPTYTLKYCLIGYFLYFIFNIVVSCIIISISPNFANVNNTTISTLTKSNFTLMAIATVILAPIVEETLYRGIIFGQLNRFNPTLAYIVSVFIFSILHILIYIGTYPPLTLFLCFLQYIPSGLLFAWVYAKTGTICAPILMHIFNNLLAFVMI